LKEDVGGGNNAPSTSRFKRTKIFANGRHAATVISLRAWAQLSIHRVRVMKETPQKLRVEVGKSTSVSALLMIPRVARACFVFAHGAGVGMTHPSMEAIATGLAERGIATLRYQFPYMEAGSRRPDPPALAHATVRAAVAEAARSCPALPLIAGGKSFGGRMTSQAQAKTPLARVAGLAFFGFPLHPTGKPSTERAAHLSDVHVPMLFLQGTNDKLAEPNLLKPLVENLGSHATLHFVAAADHSFHVPKRSGRNDGEVLAEVLDAFEAWVGKIDAQRA
jgi:predicted alpha/beta-hydrolase family hydrolase